ncbi:MAG TPA: response regulator, partial [Thermoanaerobaculia bacterium]
MPPPAPISVLLVEDSASDAQRVREALAGLEAEIALAHVDTLAAALDRLRREPAEVVLLDLGLPDSDGFATLEALQAAVPEVAVVVLTGLADESLAVAALQRGAQDYLPKRECTARVLLRVIRYTRERRRAESALLTREQRYRSLVAATSQMVWTVDPDGAAVEDSPSWRAYTGQSREEYRGHGWTSAIHPDDRERTLEAWREAAAAKGPYRIEHRVRAADGGYGDFVTRGVPLLARDGGIREWISVGIDVTRQVQLEQQLRQAQKMEAVGRLAGGIAHDFNNLLTSILGYTVLLATRLAADETSCRDLFEVQKAGERAAALTRKLLAFSRQQVLQPQLLDLPEVVAESAQRLERLLGEAVALEISARVPVGRVRADRGQLEQVLLDLAQNARDAMPAGGALRIEIAEVELAAADVAEHPEVPVGRYALLSVADTGGGMDGEVLSHLFEPFFTTKEVGKGTGLGLATVHGIVRQSEGHVTVESVAGHGTTFRIYLPLAEEPWRAGAAAPAAPAAEESETILLVDDEAGVRRLARLVLEKRGYRVLEAGSAAAAMDLVGSHPGRLDLVLTDAVMPGLSGRSLLAHVASARPEARGVLMSGYSAEEV